MELSAAIIIPDGFEEIETIAPLDILRRGGIKVSLIGYKSINVKGVHNISVQADDIFINILSQEYDCIILPGGPGCYNIRKDDTLHRLLKKHFDQKKLICAICAAPLILHDAGILMHKKYTAHPCTRDELSDIIAQPVVTDNHLITGASPEASLIFGFTILQNLTDENNAKQVANAMLFSEDF